MPNLATVWPLPLLFFAIILVICFALDIYTRNNFDLSPKKIVTFLAVAFIPLILFFGLSSVEVTISVLGSRELSPPPNIGQFRWKTDKNAAEDQPTADSMKSELKKIFYLFGSQVTVEPTGLHHLYNVYFRGPLIFLWPVALDLIQHNHFVDAIEHFSVYGEPYHGY